MKLYGYFRSSAAFRVRIALNLKGIAYEHASGHLRKGEQAERADYVALNPQELVPALVLDDGQVLDPVAGDHRVSRGDASRAAAAAADPVGPRAGARAWR